MINCRKNAAACHLQRAAGNLLFYPMDHRPSPETTPGPLLNAMKPPDSLRRRVELAGPIADMGVPRPLLTLEEFFEGNDEYGSIGCNLPDCPMPREFYEVFKEIRRGPCVADVRVEIRSWDDPGDWPFSDTIWVITSLGWHDIQQCLGRRLHADAIRVGWPDYPIEAVEVPTGTQPIGVWWD
jgi:hypothetical protein